MSHSGYQRLAQSEEADVGEGLHRPAHRSRGLRRPSRPGHIDLSKLDNAFKRWTESIAQKVKRKKKVEDYSKKEILRSVFDPPVVGTPTSIGPLKTLDHKAPMTRTDFDILAQSVRNAIAEGIHPKMISKGSSGSYFARARTEGRVQTVAVFKPKDEEPYGRLNPKTTKWIHRQFRWIIPFGRSCLIPNLSYVSEAAASLLDQRLHLHIVPRTELVSLSSPAFFYDWLDRNAVKKGKPLPEKIGSMQYFLHGYRDASDFLRKHPWPGRAISDTFDDATHRRGNLTKRFLSTIKIVCGKTGDEDDMYDDAGEEDDRVLFDVTEESESGSQFYWTQLLQQSFREELEKLVILDYLMLNTDRGADNYMIKYCEGVHEKSLVDVAPSRTARLEMPLMSELRRADASRVPQMGMSSSNPSLSHISKEGTLTPQPDYDRQPHIHIAAIDNSLSFPHEHPSGWRSYTYGWLYLPVSIIGRPFSEKTRNHFLPLLTSKQWWEETTFQLRNLFAVDPDFHPKMFNRQLAVIKGQAWNIVQSLRHSDEGPLELTRRTRAMVWDDEIEVSPDDPLPNLNGPLSASPELSGSLPPPPRPRSRSAAGDFPPPIRRTSTDASGVFRPVPFSAKFQKVHPGTTGVTLLEHLERLDAVEASLQRLGADDSVIEEEEIDVGESSSPQPHPIKGDSSAASTSHLTAIEIPDSQPAITDISASDLETSMTEEDLVAMSKSASHVEVSPTLHHNRWSSRARRNEAGRGLDFLREDEALKRKVIVERLETITRRPLCSCW